MHAFFTLAYFVAFAVIAGGAFALMNQNLRRMDQVSGRGGRRHPEAPEPGEPVMVVDLARERLEQLYRQVS
jgi:hypothetical protein